MDDVVRKELVTRFEHKVVVADLHDLAGLFPGSDARGYSLNLFR